MIYGFHDKYKKISPWWKFINAEFEMQNSHSIMCPIRGFDFEYEFGSIRNDGLLTVKKGFKWGASGLTIDGPDWCGKSSREGSCFHDLLYTFSQLGLFHRFNPISKKELADMLFLSIIIRNGMWGYRAKKWFYFVDKFGFKAWYKRNVIFNPYIGKYTENAKED